MQIPTTCCICSTHLETRDLLFLSCPYALFFWAEVRQRIRTTVPVFNDWSKLIQWTTTSSTTAPASLRMMMVVQAVIYSVWQQRNNMLQNQSLLPPMAAFRVLNRLIINSIYAFRHRKKFRSLIPLLALCFFYFLFARVSLLFSLRLTTL